MFGADAFTEDVDVEGTNRKFSLNGKDYEIDFCSTLHVHEGLKIRDSPPQQMQKMRFLKGNWGKISSEIHTTEAGRTQISGQ